MKVCARCGFEKEDSEFGIDRRYNKLRSYCRQCDLEFGKNYYRRVIKPDHYPDRPKRPVKEGHRWCLKCDIEKPISDFYTNGGNACKECALKKQAKEYAANPVKYKKRH